MESTYMRTKRASLLVAAMAAALMLGAGVALANEVPCEGGELGWSDPCGGDDPSTRPSEGDDVFYGSDFKDFMEGKGGDDSGEGKGEADHMNGGEDSDTLDGGAGGDSMNGGPGNDFFYGGEGNDRWGVGDEGNDTLEGNAGGDWLSGDEGDDLVYGDEDNDYLQGGEGADVLAGEAGNDQLAEMSSDTSPNNLIGGSGNDRIYGAIFGPNQIFGGDGNDANADGKDVIHGGNVDDMIEGDRGDDQVAASYGDDFVLGEEGNDMLGTTLNDDMKDAGANEYSGGPGNDIIKARDSENDPHIDCGEGLKDRVEVDYKLDEWLKNIDCEIISDGVGPVIPVWGPSPSTEDRTPRIQANVRDSHPRMKIQRSNIKLYVDGRQVTTFAYDPDRRLLTYTPQRNLALGKHTVKVVAKEAEGLTETKSWSFSVVQ